jgi:hypothetical protein
MQDRSRTEPGRAGECLGRLPTAAGKRAAGNAASEGAVTLKIGGNFYNESPDEKTLAAVFGDKDVSSSRHPRSGRFTLRPQDVKEIPVALQHLDEEEPNPAIAGAQRIWRSVIDVPAVEALRAALISRG